MKQINRKTFEKIIKIVNEHNKTDNLEYRQYEYDYYYIKMIYPILTDLITCFVKLGVSDEKIEQAINSFGFEIVEEE